jgi:hypothetical protein
MKHGDLIVVVRAPYRAHRLRRVRECRGFGKQPHSILSRFHKISKGDDLTCNVCPTMPQGWLPCCWFSATQRRSEQ